MNKISINYIKEKLNLESFSSEEHLNNNYISSVEVNRPGLALTGNYNHFPKDRIQIIGKQEMSYMLSLDKTTLRERLRTYFEFKPPCIVITRGLPLTDFFIRESKMRGIPILRTEKKTTDFISLLYNFLHKELAEEFGIHGVCVNVAGVGILIRGSSGIGKSEVALSLIDRGHRLVSDDLVVLKKIGPVALIGTHNNTNKDFLSLRGIGFVNIPRLYGAGAIQNETKIDLDIYLSEWQDGTYYDAVCNEERRSEYLGISVPLLSIPVRPGRDLANLIEVSAMDWRLKQQGYNSLTDFYNRLENPKNN